MDPLTAIGLVSNILSFVEFSSRLLKGAKEVYDSQHGVLEDNRSRETVMREMQRMSTLLSVSKSHNKAGHDSSLCILASECRQLSTQLISLLEKIKPHDSGSKAQSLLSAVRNKTYESERESLEARLSDCRAQLHLELSNLTSSETLKRLESLVQASKSDEAKLDRIESDIAHLREHVKSNSAAPEVTAMVTTLITEEEKVFAMIAQDRILQCLSFEGMSRRSNMVVETHANTYEWILEDDAPATTPDTEDEVSDIERETITASIISDDIEKLRARDKLRAWLESETSGDVFHLSGKLGSGKSTLMKHIRGSPHTEEKLNKWADGRKLTIASFYFWNIGSDYEKSLQGLYISLLHQIFSQCPDIIPQVWPTHWAQAYSPPWLVPRVIEATRKDIMQAFKRVITSVGALKTHCFAFFIDGLDEFQSNVQDDHRDLVRLLCHWAAAESGSIKICVSSREYPVFMDGFTETLRIRFHDLTRRDMDTYIRDKLAHASTQESFENLVSLIMNKADGVFLWVALVVKSLREGLENGLSCDELTREVDILPDQLESLYSHILASLGKSALKKAYQTFAMVKELKKENYRMSLLAYSFIEEYELRKGFFTAGRSRFPIESVTGDRGKRLVHSTSRKLAGWCKGLVEPYGNPMWLQDQSNDRLKGRSPCVDEWGDWSMELDFAHRSVSDFLESDEIQYDMKLKLKYFDPVDAVLQLIVSDILFESSLSVYNSLRSGITGAVFVRTTNRNGLAREPFTHFERFRELLASTKPNYSMTLRGVLTLTYPWEAGRFGTAFCIEFMGKLPETATGGRTDSFSRARHFSDPLHILTALGLSDYPLWHISNGILLDEDSDTISTLASLCLDEGFGGKDYSQSLIVLEALFSQGWVSPDSITKYRGVRYGSMWSDDGGYYSALNSDLTLWHRFLVKMLSSRYHQVSRSMDEYQRTYHNKISRQYDGKLLELFLRFTKDTDFSYEIFVDGETTVSTRDFVLNLGKQGLILKFRTVCYEQQDLWDLPWMESEIGLPSEDGKPARRHVSLREFIELSAYENEAVLLRLLDQNSETSNGEQPSPSNSTTKAPVPRGEGSMEDRMSSVDQGRRTRNAGGAPESKLINPIGSQRYLYIVSRRVQYSLRNEYFRYALAVLTGVILTTLYTSVLEKLARRASD
ncbi:hypothetical protein KVR01_006329 [Diaporthe batatas]|uniref:uncharacterized protein n=1 Tax=Diaporthe batatas TaxID=748121 RepID=UPI001D040196|nr:uncharacterized protein KVR01_006329 [Diaporthe batatas]KAG8164411.1 hypothetical protein KVR01_006329 [Diaporthe batatas]